MRQKQVPILLMLPDQWQLVQAAEAGDTRTWEEDVLVNFEGVAEQVAQALYDMGCHRSPLVLALPSGQCFSSRLEPEPGSGRAWRKAMLYQLEEQVPVAAEEVVADFLACPASDTEPAGVLGVCTSVALLGEKVAALSAVGVRVGPITPLAMLALEQILTDCDADLVLVGEGETLSIFVIQEGRPTTWWLAADDVDDVRALLSLIVVDQPRLMCIGVSESLPGELERYGMSISVIEADTARLAAARAGDLVASGRRPMINFYRDPVTGSGAIEHVRTPAWAAAAALMLLLTVLATTLLITAARYDHQTQALRAQQLQTYRTLLPEAHDTPVDVTRRLMSHHQALQDRAGAPMGATTGPSALLLLRDVFERLPEDVPLQLQRLRVDERGIELTGQTRSHQQAQRVSVAMGTDRRFNVDPPQSTTLRDGGVSFTIRAWLEPDGTTP